MPKNSSKPMGAPMRKGRPMMAKMNKGTTGVPSGSASMPHNKEYAMRAGKSSGSGKHHEGPQTKMKMGGDN